MTDSNLKVSSSHVQSQDVSSDVFHRVVTGDPFADRLDDHAQLDLVVDLFAADRNLDDGRKKEIEIIDRALLTFFSNDVSSNGRRFDQKSIQRNIDSKGEADSNEG
jgi:hypothetical protein